MLKFPIIIQYNLKIKVIDSMHYLLAWVFAGLSNCHIENVSTAISDTIQKELGKII